MKQLSIVILTSMVMFSSAMSVTVEGTLITQVKGITENVMIRSSSNPAIEQQPGADGVYAIETSSLSQDFILISPQESDATLYSPRIIPASRVNTDTLYIIPPTNPTLSIIVDNKTNRDFTFLVDKSIIIEELATSEKDYQLQVIPHRAGATTLFVAGLTPDYPAVVKSVRFNPAQRQGYLTIEPQDIGLAPTPVPTPPPTVVQPQPTYIPAPTVQQPPVRREAPAPSQRAEEVTEPEPAPQQESEIQEPPAPQETATTHVLEPQLKKDDSARIVALQTAYYFSDRFVLKNRQSASLAVRGDYQTFPNTSESTQILNVGVDLYNIKILKGYFDLSASASSSEQLAENYYRGSLTWHHSPYASIDVAYKSTENDVWYSQYDVAFTSLGINGYYKSQGVGFQFGAGVRFQVDYGDFNSYFADLVEKNYRYLQSFYLLGSSAFGSSTAAFMAGVINESIYASVSFLFFKYIGVNYTFKNKSMENSYFTPLEQELKHQLSFYINLTLKNRERY